MTRRFITYVATATAVGYGYLEDFAEIQSHTATLLVHPAADRTGLAGALQRLSVFIARDENRVGGHPLRSDHVDARSADSRGASIAISWSGSDAPGAAQALIDSKRHGPAFGSFSGAANPVAFVVDADLSPAAAASALGRLAEYALGDEGDFFAPLPERRVLHRAGEIHSYSQDGTPLRDAGATTHEGPPPPPSSAPSPIVAPSGVTVPHPLARPR